MREILFRAKRLDNGEWVYGYLDCYNGVYSIVNNDGEYEVDENTIGEFTGVYDRNNKRIFEGDIVHEQLFNTKGTKYNDHNFEVRFSGGRFCAFKGNVNMNSMLCYTIFTEVIGNIYENKELLEVKK